MGKADGSLRPGTGIRTPPSPPCHPGVHHPALDLSSLPLTQVFPSPNPDFGASGPGDPYPHPTHETAGLFPMNPFSGSLSFPSGYTTWPCSPLHPSKSPGTPQTCGLALLLFFPCAPLLPCPLPCLWQGHEEGTVQAGLEASEPLSSRRGVPMTPKRNSASNKIWGWKECASFFLLALTFGAHRGILAALASHSTSYLLSFPLFSLPAPCLPSSSSPHL